IDGPTAYGAAENKSLEIKTPRPPPRCRAVRDSTLVAWYRSLYAPRTGGAYDSHHRTAGIAGCTRRRCDGVAARGECAAAKLAGWSTSQRIAHYVRAVNDCISAGPSGGRLH